MGTFKVTISVALWLGSAASLVGCGLEGARYTQETVNGFYALDGAVQSWPEGSKVKFSFARDFPFQLRKSIVLGSRTYNEFLHSVTFDLDASRESAPLGSAGPAKATGDGTNGLYWLDEPWPWEKSHPNSDAMTIVRLDKGRIVEADVYFRASSYSTKPQLWTLSSEAREGRVLGPQEKGELDQLTLPEQWLYLITVHELGHVLGRTHTDEEDSIMRPTVSLRRLSEPLTSFDLEALSVAYRLRDAIP